MSIQDRIENLKTFQIYLIDFLDKDEQSEESFHKLSNLLSNHDFGTNLQELRPFINIIQNNSRNHHRSPAFNDKISRVLTILFDDLKQKNNYSIFNMFKNDKRLLLYLIEKEILVIDDKIANLMKKGKYKIYNYPQYFNLDKKEEYNIERKGEERMTVMYVN